MSVEISRFRRRRKHVAQRTGREGIEGRDLIVIVVDFKVMMSNLKVLNGPAIPRNGAKMRACQVTFFVNFVTFFAKQRAYEGQNGGQFGRRGVDSFGMAGMDGRAPALHLVIKSNDGDARDSRYPQASAVGI